MARIGMASPWVIYVKELEQLFKYDPEVHVVYDEDKNEVKLYVDSGILKATAIAGLLPEKKSFGSVELIITVFFANGIVVHEETLDDLFEDNESLFTQFFTGNGCLSFVKTIRGIFTNDLTYVVFKNEVVQYFNDDLSDVYGQKSTLFQDIASHLLIDKEGVFYCTDICWYNDITAPLGEWP